MDSQKRTIIYAALIAVFSLLHVGCETVNSVERTNARATPHVVNDRRIITDYTLKNKAQVVQIIEGKVGNGLLKIQAEILNTTWKRKRFNYRFEWINQDGMLVETPMSNWKRISLAGRETKMISGIAPTPQVVDFHLKLVEPPR